MIIYGSVHDKRDLMVFPVCDYSNAYAQSPIRATDMHVLLEANPRSLLHVCEQQRLWRDCGYAQTCRSLYWSDVSYTVELQ